jgi:hypothetical protein
MTCRLCGAVTDTRAKVCPACKPKAAVARARAWYLENKERKREYDAAYRAARRDYWRAVAKRHRDRNPEAKKADTGVRRKRSQEATPIWANRFFIKEIYALAIQRTALTGRKWHVDHVIPLKHPAVCGLHVPANLRVVPAEINLRKHNRYEVV